MGVDLEHHALRSYLGVTCLLQLSVREPPQPPQIPQPAGHQQHQGEQQDEQHQAQQGGSSSSPAFAPAPGAAHGSPRRPPPPGETWLVDVLSPQLHDHVGAALGPLMADPRVVKVGKFGQRVSVSYGNPALCADAIAGTGAAHGRPAGQSR